MDWDSLWKATPPEEWLLDPVLPRGRSIALYSPAKSGKSLVALDLAARLATGQRVLNRPAGEPVSVLYVDLEMTQADLRERLSDIGYDASSDLSRLHYALLPSLPPLDTPAGGAAALALANEHDSGSSSSTRRAASSAAPRTTATRSEPFTGSRACH